MTTWTEERIEQFKSLYAQGLSHREIGAYLGISRNACIGKATRLGLEKRRPVRQPKPWVAAGVKERTWHRWQAKANGRAPQARRGPQQLTQYVDKRIAADAAQPFVLDEVRFMADLARMPITLMELEAHNCRFPVGEARNPNEPMLYCGAAKCGENYSPYCAVHHRIAYPLRPRGGVFVLFRNAGRMT